MLVGNGGPPTEKNYFLRPPEDNWCPSLLYNMYVYGHTSENRRPNLVVIAKFVRKCNK